MDAFACVSYPYNVGARVAPCFLFPTPRKGAVGRREPFGRGCGGRREDTYSEGGHGAYASKRSTARA
jgi:hypothetical protein